MDPTRRITLLALVLTAGCAAAQRVPEAYTLVELAPLGGGTESFVSAINDRGEIVGRTEFGTGPIATSWDLGGTASLVTISGGGPATHAVSINNEGSMLVECSGCTTQGLGVRLADGTLLQLPVPAGSDSIRLTREISPGGTVSGVRGVRVGDSGSVYDAVLWQYQGGSQLVPSFAGGVSSNSFGAPYAVAAENGSVVVLLTSAPSGDSSFIRIDPRTGGVDDYGTSAFGFLYAANAGGDIVINDSDGPPFSELFLRRLDGSLDPIFGVGCDGFCPSTDIVDPIPGALSESGIVVGTSPIYDAASFEVVGSTGFIWSAAAGTTDLAGLATDGSASGWQLVRDSGDPFVSIGPADINEAGVIVGNGINPNGDPAAYVLIPRSPCAADTNRDGAVTPADYNAWILSFNNGCD